MVNNHPGDPSPSPEDVRITADAVAAGLLLDIEVLDHVVIGQPAPDREAFVSLKERAWASNEVPRPSHAPSKHRHGTWDGPRSATKDVGRGTSRGRGSAGRPSRADCSAPKTIS